MAAVILSDSAMVLPLLVCLGQTRMWVCGEGLLPVLTLFHITDDLSPVSAAWRGQKLTVNKTEPWINIRLMFDMNLEKQMNTNLRANWNEIFIIKITGTPPSLQKVRPRSCRQPVLIPILSNILLWLLTFWTDDVMSRCKVKYPHHESFTFVFCFLNLLYLTQNATDFCAEA